jgi:hypothetical protein
MVYRETQEKLPVINFDLMSPRLRLVAEGIVLQHRYHQLVVRSNSQPGILKSKLALHLVQTINQNASKLGSMEREGVKSFRDYCLHREFRGNCPHSDCETYMYPLNFLAWFAYWVENNPEDEEQLLALWCKFGVYPTYGRIELMLTS